MGAWGGPYDRGGLLLELEQQGSTVKGSVRFTAGQSPALGIVPGPIDGTMTGDVLHFNDARRSLEGELTVRGDEMNGMLVGLFGRRPLSLRRVDSSSGPVSPPR